MNPSLLPTARVSISRSDHQVQSSRALLDSVSQVSFITGRAVSYLCLPVSPSSVGVSVLEGSFYLSCPGYTTATIQVPNSDLLSLQLFVIENITHSLPAMHVDLSPWPYIRELPPADPSLCHPDPIDLLFGVDALPGILLGIELSHKDGPTALNTIFGWFFMGECRPLGAKHHITMAKDVKDNKGETFRPPLRPRRAQSSGNLTPNFPSPIANAVTPERHELSVFNAPTNVQLNRDLQRFWDLEEVASSALALSPGHRIAPWSGRYRPSH